MLFLSKAERGASARREALRSVAQQAPDVAEFHEAGLQIEIVDDGAGAFDLGLLRRALSNLLRGDTVAAEHLPHLFDRFYRADAAREHADRNHGLGLSIVAAIARMHCGRPFARSEAGVTTIGLQLRV